MGPNPVDLHVGVRLKAKRTELGLSQERLGQQLGFGARQIQKYENAANRISASKLFELADILKVPVSYFYEGLQSKPVPREPQLSAQPKAALVNEEEAPLLVEHFAQMGPSAMRRQLVELVKAMAAHTPRLSPEQRR